MKTPIRILFWTFMHDQAEHLWGYIWRKKLAPYHEQKWKEEVERNPTLRSPLLASLRNPVTLTGGGMAQAFAYVSPDAKTVNLWDSSSLADTDGYDLYSSTPGSGYNKIKEVRWDTHVWDGMLQKAYSSRSDAPQQPPETLPVSEPGNITTKP